MTQLANKEQLSAINSSAEKLVIIAPPGSGKTFTMIKAIDKFLEQKDKNVTAITFTKKAAGELSTEFFGDDRVHAATIHSWSYSHLEKMGKKWGFRVRLLQEEQIKSILKPFLKLYKLRENAINSVYFYAMGNYNIDLTAPMKNKYKAILNKYIEFKRKRKLYDFTDLPLYLYDVLSEYEEFIEVDGLFVDEFQDVDPVQLSVFNRVVAEKYFMIGDPRQSIYIFRGATEEIFNELDGYKIINLKENYRSYQEILDYASSVRNGLLHGYTSILDVNEIRASDIIAEKGNGANLLVESQMTNIDFRKQVVKELTDHQYQILVRTNKEVKEIKSLGIDMVSTIHQAKGLEFPNVIVTDFEAEDEEGVNVAFVALTRAENREIVISFELLMRILKMLPKDVLKKLKLIISAF